MLSISWNLEINEACEDKKLENNWPKYFSFLSFSNPIAASALKFYFGPSPGYLAFLSVVYKISNLLKMVKSHYFSMFPFPNVRPTDMGNPNQ